MLDAGVEKAGHTVVNKQFFDTLTIRPRVDASVIVQQARNKEINMRCFQDGMVGDLIIRYFVHISNEHDSLCINFFL